MRQNKSVATQRQIDRRVKEENTKTTYFEAAHWTS